MVNGLLIQVLGRDNSLDDLLLDLLAKLLCGDCLSVLSTDNNSVYSNRHNGTVIMLVLYSDLSLGVRSEPWEAAVATSSRHCSIELVSQLKSEWEQFWGLISGISEHDTLVTSSQLLKCGIVVETLSDIGGLLLDGNKNVASLVVEALCRVIVSNVLDRTSDNLLVVELGLGSDLAENHHHTSLGCSLASDLGERVISKAGIENSIGDLISDLVWVTFANGLGLKEMSVFASKSVEKGLELSYSEL